MKVSWLLYLSIFIVGCSLTAINIYGLFQNIRPEVIFNDELRFKNDQPLAFSQTIDQLEKQPHESDADFASRATSVISKGVAHIHWERYEPEKFNQLVPIWENYFLYFMGKLSNIPEYEKYHFADYKKSLKRGIGICGDTSMILSQVLDNNSISNEIITFPGHVIVSANNQIFDADFGVTLPFNPDEIKQTPSLVNEYYLKAGYFAYDIRAFNRIYDNEYKRWNGVKHFITNKYYFEKISYFLKWILPIIMILVAMFGLRKNLKKNHKFSDIS